MRLELRVLKVLVVAGPQTVLALLALPKQAMFWLGQSKDGRATSFFEEVLTR